MKKIFIKLLNSDTWHRKALNKALLFSLCLIMQMVTGTPVYGETKDSEQATKKEISGSVYDTDELPLPGATVIEKNNSMNSTLTDADGLFKLTVSEGSIVIISYLGYITQEFVVDRANSYPIILHEDTKDLDEVVVVGYGTIKKKDLTGAVGAISGNIVSDRKVMQLSTALQGAIPGVMVTRNNGAPGGGSTIRIRGITTIGDSNPLYIVDGVPVDNIDYRPTFYGMLVAYKMLKDKKYLDAAVKGADWYVKNAVANGSFVGVCGDVRFVNDFATAQSAQALLDLYQ